MSRDLLYGISIITLTLVNAYTIRAFIEAEHYFLSIIPLCFICLICLATFAGYESRERNRAHELRIEEAKLDAQGIVTADETEKI
jgi:hypothetical protein